jgi:integrase/recombinase XerC
VSAEALTLPAVQKTIDDLLGRKSENTERAYRGDVADFMKFAKEKSSPAHALLGLLRRGRVGARQYVEAYEKKLMATHAQATSRRRVAAMQSFVSAARKDGLVDWNLEINHSTSLSEETRRATSKRKMAGPKPDGVLAVRDMLLRENTLTARRDLAIISLLVNPMLRRAEVARLRVGDFDLDDANEATVRILGKGRTETEPLDLDPKVVVDVKTWLAVRGGRPGDPAFVQIKQKQVIPHRGLTDAAIYFITKKRGKEAGLKRPLRPHGLRHTGITEVANYIAANGLPVTEGMAVSRHKDAKTFWGYVDRKGSQRRKILGAVAAKTS